MKQFNQILSNLYFNPNTGFKGVNDIYRESKKVHPNISRKYVKQWLENQNTYTIHKPSRKRYGRNKVLVSSIDEQWQADLVDLQSLEKHNEGYRYLLTCIDLFSKFAWAIPLKSKTSENVKNAFIYIFQTGRKPYKLQTDAGTEFINKEVQKFLKSVGVDFFTTNSEMKASVVERFNRTLKERMWRYFTFKNTHKYIDILADHIIEP